MIPLEPHEKIVKAFEVKASNHGRGTLYVTSYGIAFESQKYGVVVDVSFEWLRSYAAKKDGFQLVWDMPKGQRFMYVLKVDSKAAANAYSVANKEYADSVSEVEALMTKLERTPS